VEADRHHITLPRLGNLKTHESTRKLARRLEQGTARIIAATISRTADRWFVSFTVEVQRTIPASNGKPSIVGVDVGIRHLAVLSTGQTIPNPRALERSLRKLGRLNRQLHHHNPGSSHRHQTRRRLARVHARAANLRRDALHKLTTYLATEHGTIVVEQLNLAGMVRNRRLARALSDSGLAELRRQLAYKTTWYGCRLVVADRFYPSSKTCSACGWVKAKLTLAERIFTCETCGLRIDRDLNAARNLAQLVQHVAQSGWETPNARGADRSPSLLGRWRGSEKPAPGLARVRPAPSSRKARLPDRALDSTRYRCSRSDNREKAAVAPRPPLGVLASAPGERWTHPAPTATRELRYGLIPQSRPPEKQRSRIAAPMNGSGLYPRPESSSG
jgi:putative transposase